MQKAHDSSKNQAWKDYPNITTPIIAAELNRVETSMDTIDDRVVAFDTTKANQTDMLGTIKNVTYDSSTGTFTFTKYNDSTIVVNTDIEKIAVNFDYDNDPTSSHYQNLIITLADGTVKYADLSALITQYEFTNSSTISFTVSSSGAVSASVIDGSITANKLQPNFLADCNAAKTGAETAKSGADASALVSEGWAKGTQNGTDVDSSSPYYHNNAKYYKEQAQAAASGQVQSDWTENDQSSKAYILHKPTIPSSVGDLSGGTLAGKVQANAAAQATLADFQVRDITISPNGLTPGTSTLAAGKIWIKYKTS